MINIAPPEEAAQELRSVARIATSCSAAVGRISVAIDIDAPPEAVWRVVEPVEDHVDWMATRRRSASPPSRREAWATTTVVDTKVGPLHVSDHMTITEWVEGEVIGVEHTGVVTGRAATLRRTGKAARRSAGTRTSTSRGGWAGWWARPSAAGSSSRVWRRNLQALKHLVEEGQRSVDADGPAPVDGEGEPTDQDGQAAAGGH